MSKKSASSEMPIRILKIGTCPTLSGRSELTYHIGSNTDGEVYIRVVQNSGNGQFNADWVPVTLIERLLTEQPADKPMTSRVLLPVFRGKSSNSPAFLFAVLKAEGLVKTGAEKDSGYLLGDIKGFREAVAALIAAGTDLNASSVTPPEPPKKRRPAKASAVTLENA
jgi:hypothetical protein